MKKIVTGLVVIAGVFIVFTILNQGCAKVADGGCCATSDGCASGVGVTDDFCTTELNGTWNATNPVTIFFIFISFFF